MMENYLAIEYPENKLTGIFIQDSESGGFTAFFSEKPGAVAEGDNLKDAEDNLFKTHKWLLQFESEE